MRPHHTRSAGTATFVFHPSYDNPTTITEGTTPYYYIQTTGVSNGTTLYWSITHGTTTNADFSANSGSFTVNNNLGQFYIFPTNDGIGDAGETFTLNIRTESISGSVVLTRSITVNDPPPHYTLSLENHNVGHNYYPYMNHGTATALQPGYHFTSVTFFNDNHNGHTYYWQITDFNGNPKTSYFSGPTSGYLYASVAGNVLTSSFDFTTTSNGGDPLLYEYFQIRITNVQTNNIVSNQVGFFRQTPTLVFSGDYYYGYSYEVCLNYYQVPFYVDQANNKLWAFNAPFSGQLKSINHCQQSSKGRIDYYYDGSFESASGLCGGSQAQLDCP